MTKSVDDYLASFPPTVRERLAALRAIFRETAPDSVEKIAWGAPTYYLGGRYYAQFAANKTHVGFYTSPATVGAFEEALAAYETNGKNTVRFPYEQELPRALIEAMLKFRRRELESQKKESKPHD